MTDEFDMSEHVAPNCDHLTADDLLGGPRKITVTKTVKKRDPKRTVAVHFEGDDGRPFLPCLTMRRVILAMWGKRGYAGKSMVLFRDPNVSYGGERVGGIRISHMSHIERDTEVPVTVSQGKRGKVRIKKLDEAGGASTNRPPGNVARCLTLISQATDLRDTKKKLSEFSWQNDERAALGDALVFRERELEAASGEDFE